MKVTVTTERVCCSPSPSSASVSAGDGSIAGVARSLGVHTNIPRESRPRALLGFMGGPRQARVPCMGDQRFALDAHPHTCAPPFRNLVCMPLRLGAGLVVSVAGNQRNASSAQLATGHTRAPRISEAQKQLSETKPRLQLGTPPAGMALGRWHGLHSTKDWGRNPAAPAQLVNPAQVALPPRSAWAVSVGRSGRCPCVCRDPRPEHAHTLPRSHGTHLLQRLLRSWGA